MKKIFGILLIACLVFSVYPTSLFADEIIENKDLEGVKAENGVDDLKKNIKVSHIGHGEYVKLNDSDLEGEQATLIDGQTVYKLNDGTYLSYINDTTLYEVEKINVKLVDKDKIDHIFEEYDLSEAVKDDILERSKKAIDSQNQLAEVTLYTNAVPKQDDNINTMALSTRYYQYDGKYYKEDLIYYNSLYTGFHTIKSGVDTADVAKAIYDTSIYAATRVGTHTVGAVISLFSNYINAWQNYLNLCNCTAQEIKGSTKDKLQINVKYDIQTRYTYVKDGSYYVLGAITERAYIYHVESREYHVLNNEKGKEVINTRYVNTYYRSPKDATAASTAALWMGDPWYENLKVKIPGTSVYIDF